MAKDLTLNDILTKITNVFKTDMYIVDDCICIGGNESEESNPGTFICFLTKQCSDIVKESFPNSRVIQISDMRKAKTDLDNFSKELKGKQAHEIAELSDELYSVVKKPKTWNQFVDNDEIGITSDDMNDIMKNGNIKFIFNDNNDKPSIPIGKSLFPLVTSKNTSDIVYSYMTEDKNTGLHTFILSLDTDLFQIYNIIYAIKV